MFLLIWIYWTNFILEFIPHPTIICVNLKSNQIDATCEFRRNDFVVNLTDTNLPVSSSAHLFEIFDPLFSDRKLSFLVRQNCGKCIWARIHHHHLTHRHLRIFFIFYCQNHGQNPQENCSLLAYWQFSYIVLGASLGVKYWIWLKTSTSSPINNSLKMKTTMQSKRGIR